ncbi:MAG: hypothetical protein V2A54_03280 [Bacteroidota bacterium]
MLECETFKIPIDKLRRSDIVIRALANSPHQSFLRKQEPKISLHTVSNPASVIPAKAGIAFDQTLMPDDFTPKGYDLATIP